MAKQEYITIVDRDLILKIPVKIARLSFINDAYIFKADARFCDSYIVYKEITSQERYSKKERMIIPFGNQNRLNFFIYCDPTIKKPFSDYSEYYGERDILICKQKIRHIGTSVGNLLKTLNENAKLYYEIGNKTISLSNFYTLNFNKYISGTTNFEITGDSKDFTIVNEYCSNEEKFKKEYFLVNNFEDEFKYPETSKKEGGELGSLIAAIQENGSENKDRIIKSLYRTGLEINY